MNRVVFGEAFFNFALKQNYCKIKRFIEKHKREDKK